MDGVSAVADSSHAVERGDADAGGEISVGASADGGFFQLPIDVVRDGLRFFVERGDAGGAFHGQAVDAAVDGELAVFVEGLQGAKLFGRGWRPASLLDADVDLDRGFGGDDVGAGSAADDAGVDGESPLRSVNFEMAVIWRANSRMALCPLPGSSPAWAAMPLTVRV